MPRRSTFVHGLCAVLAASLIAPPVAVAAKPKKTKTEVLPTSKNERALDPDLPDAGDSGIPDAPLEPGQIQPGRQATGGPARQGASVQMSSRKPNVGNEQLAAEFDAAAAQHFDAANYREAARLWVKALETLAENESNRITRSAMLQNAVTAYEQLYVESGDVELLNRAQLVISDYLRMCKRRYGGSCDRYQETTDARKRLEELLKRIDEAQPKVKKIPPEIDTAPGGRPFNRMVKLPSAPGWIGPTFAIGVALIGGGIGLAYWAQTDPRFEPEDDETALKGKIRFRDMHETGDTGEDTGPDPGGMTGSTSTSSLPAIEIPNDVKGSLATVAGVFMAAAGVGLIVLASIKLAKHRRINRERAAVLSLVPTFGPRGGGLGLSGRF